MEHVCPLCNGLTKINILCEKCKGVMKDQGRIQDYYDNYSPYLSYSITNLMDGESDNICQHIFTCNNCGFDKILDITKKII